MFPKWWILKPVSVEFSLCYMWYQCKVIHRKSSLSGSIVSFLGFDGYILFVELWTIYPVWDRGPSLGESWPNLPAPDLSGLFNQVILSMTHRVLHVEKRLRNLEVSEVEILRSYIFDILTCLHWWHVGHESFTRPPADRLCNIEALVELKLIATCWHRQQLASHTVLLWKPYFFASELRLQKLHETLLIRAKVLLLASLSFIATHKWVSFCLWDFYKSWIMLVWLLFCSHPIPPCLREHFLFLFHHFYRRWHKSCEAGTFPSVLEEWPTCLCWAWRWDRILPTVMLDVW